VYIQGEEKIMMKHSEKKKHNKTLNIVSTRKTGYISRLAGCGSMEWTTIWTACWLFRKMYCIIGLKLIYVR